MLATRLISAPVFYKSDKSENEDTSERSVLIQMDPDSCWDAINLSELKTCNSYDHAIEREICKKIADVNKVEYIYYSRQGEVNSVWVIINELDRGVRKQIYKKQMAIMDYLRTELFDFHVVARMNKPLTSIINQENISLIYKKTAG